MEGCENDKEYAGERQIPPIGASKGGADAGNHAAGARAKEFWTKTPSWNRVSAGWRRNTSKTGSRLDRRSAVGTETGCLGNFFAAMCAVHEGLQNAFYSVIRGYGERGSQTSGGGEKVPAWQNLHRRAGDPRSLTRRWLRLVTGKRRLEVFACLVGLVSAASGNQLVLNDGLFTLMQEVEHLPRVQLSSFAEPVAAVRLRG